MITWEQRRAQIKHLLYEHCLNDRISREVFKEHLHELNSVEPVKHGKWVIEPGSTVMHCDVCGWAFEYYDGLEEEWNYCTHCGAKMQSTMSQLKSTEAVNERVKGKMKGFETIVEQPKPMRNGLRLGEEILKIQFIGTEIVRCKDCKWYKEGKYFAPTKFCFRLKDEKGEEVGYNFASDDFCSYGERRGDDGIH